MKRLIPLITSVLLLPLLHAARASDWYLHADMGGSDNWNTLADWWSAPEGGVNPTAISGTDNFFSNGCLIRTPGTNAASTFGGASLTLRGAGIAVKTLSTTLPTTIGNLICYVGSISDFNSTQVQNVAITNLACNGNFTMSNLNVTIGTLTGNGDISIIGNRNMSVAITSATGYYGTMYASGTAAAVTFPGTFVSGGAFVVPAGLPVTVNANVTFSALTVGGTAKAAGTYTAASLGFTGTGSVTVVPAASYYLHADEPQPTSWLTGTNWWSAPTGGTNPPAVGPNDDFFTNGHLLRTPEVSTASTFPGATLTLNGGNMLLKEKSSTAAITVGNFNSSGAGGGIQQGGAGTMVLKIGNLAALSTATNFDTLANNRAISASVGILSGTGAITQLGHGGGNLTLGVYDACHYTGTFSMSPTSTGTLAFQSSIFSAGPLVIGTGNSVIVNGPVSFAGLTVGGTVKPAGVYTAASLGFSGTGSVTVTNRPPQMFGVNESGMEFSSGVFVPKDASLGYYQGKGLTLIRMPFKWERIQTALNGPLDPTQMANLDLVLARANARGMKVIIDMHNFGAYGGNQIGSAGTPYSAYQDVWTKLAAHFAASPDAAAIYAYDIMNEPNAASLDWPTAAQYGINGVRAGDNSHFIMIEGKSYSSASAWPRVNAGLINITDPQNKLMFSAHCYFANANNDQYDTYDNEGAYPNKGIDKVAPFVEWCKIHKVYGHIGEYGVPYTDARWNPVLQNFLQYLSDNGISGTYWGAGAWPATYLLSVEPTSNYTVDRPQMSALQLFHQ